MFQDCITANGSSKSLPLINCPEFIWCHRHRSSLREPRRTNDQPGESRIIAFEVNHFILVVDQKTSGCWFRWVLQMVLQIEWRCAVTATMTKKAAAETARGQGAHSAVSTKCQIRCTLYHISCKKSAILRCTYLLFISFLSLCNAFALRSGTIGVFSNFTDVYLRAIEPQAVGGRVAIPWMKIGRNVETRRRSNNRACTGGGRVASAPSTHLIVTRSKNCTRSGSRWIKPPTSLMCCGAPGGAPMMTATATVGRVGSRQKAMQRKN